MAPPTPEQMANAAWRQVYEEGPYTGVIMIDHLRQRAGIANWNQVLKEGYSKNKGLKGLSSVSARRDELMKDAQLKKIWKGQTGRCTSFAVKVIDLLDKSSPGTFKFRIYDIGRHRVARCEKTGVLIDSSSQNGAFVLREGEWARHEGSEASWKWIKGKSKFERVEGVSGVVSYFLHLFPTLPQPSSPLPPSIPSGLLIPWQSIPFHIPFLPKGLSILMLKHWS